MNVTIAGVSPRRRIRVTRLLCAGFRRSLTEVVRFVVAALLLHELHGCAWRSGAAVAVRLVLMPNPR